MGRDSGCVSSLLSSASLASSHANVLYNYCCQGCMRILLVEDERKVASFIARTLRENAYAVDIADTGEKASGTWPGCKLRRHSAGCTVARDEWN